MTIIKKLCIANLLLKIVTIIKDESLIFPIPSSLGTTMYNWRIKQISPILLSKLYGLMI